MYACAQLEAKSPRKLDIKLSERFLIPPIIESRDYAEDAFLSGTERPRAAAASVAGERSGAVLFCLTSLSFSLSLSLPLYIYIYIYIKANTRQTKPSEINKMPDAVPEACSETSSTGSGSPQEPAPVSKQKRIQIY